MNYILRHHGILGQKWGVRNGPPYPLGISDHSASEKKAGWRKSLSKQDSDRERNKTTRKNAVNHGRDVVGSVLAGIGGSNLFSPRIQEFSNAGQKYLNSYTRKDTNLKRKEKEFTFSQDLSVVNPNYDPNIKKPTIWNTNCGHCVTAYEFRKRGFDVTATPVTEKEMKQGGTPTSEYKQVFPGLSFKKVGSSSAILQKILLGGVFTSVSSKEYANLCQQLEAYGDGARGFVFGFGRFGGGHVFSWEVRNGHVQFIDPQTSTEDVSGYFQDGRFASGTLEYARVDNLRVNEEAMSKYAMNRR